MPRGVWRGLCAGRGMKKAASRMGAAFFMQRADLHKA